MGRGRGIPSSAHWRRHARGRAHTKGWCPYRDVFRPFRYPVQPFILRLGAFGAEPMNTHNRRRIARFPHITTVPKGRHAQLRSLRLGEDHIQRDLIEWVRIRAVGAEHQLDHDIGLHRLPLKLCGNGGPTQEPEKERHRGFPDCAHLLFR